MEKLEWMAGTTNPKHIIYGKNIYKNLENFGRIFFQFSSID
jgi:hypothetical protein